MATKKLGLSGDDHTALGEELAALRDRLGSIATQLSPAYRNKIAGVALKAQSTIDKLRSELDNRVFAEHSGLSTKSNISVYYPDRSRD